MPTIQEVRQQYPQYSDMSDQALADALHSKFYSDMPKADFESKIGLSQQPTTRGESPSVPLDVAKGVGVGAVKAIESAPATIPILTGLAGQGAQALLDKFAPGFTDPITLQNEAKMRELAAQARGGGVAAMLPQPETGYGKAASYATQYALPAAGLKGGIVRNTVGGVGAGVGAYGAGQLAPDESQRPYYEAAGSLLAAPAALKAADKVGQNIASKFVPSAAQIGGTTDTGYKALREDLRNIPVAPNVLSDVADQAKQALIEKGPIKAKGVLNDIAEFRDNPGTSAAGISDLRSALRGHYRVPETPIAEGMAVAMGQPPNIIALNKGGAGNVEPVVNALLDRAAPGTSAKLRELDRNYAISKGAESLDKKLASQDAAANFITRGEALKKKVGTFLASNDAKYISPEAKSAMQDVIQPSVTQKILDLYAGLTGAGGTGPLGRAAAALAPAAGVGASYYTGDPTYAALGATGLGARALSSHARARNAKLASALLRSESALGQAAPMRVRPTMTKRQASLIASALAARGISGPNQ